jgi:hypothetical protein
MAIIRGVAKTIVFPMWDATDPTKLISGLTPTTVVSKDGGAEAATTNSAAEIGTTGLYALQLTATEMDADLITVKATATGACDQVISLETENPKIEQNLDAAISSIAASVWGYAGRSLDSVANIAQAVWEYASRTLTGFGTLVSDIWAYATRTLTAGTKDTEVDAIKAQTDKLTFDASNNVYSTPQTDVTVAAASEDSIAAKVWAYTTRTLTSFGNLVSDIWSYATRSLTTRTVGTETLPTAEEIDSQLTASHGAGSWQQAGVAGSLAVKVILQDANTNPIADAVVTITSDQNGLNVVDSKSTNANGEAEFNLDAGTYYVRPRKTGWTFPVSTEWVIATNGDSITVQGSPVTHTAPSSDYGLLYGWLKDSRGNALANKEIKISLSRPATYNQEVLDKEFSVMTDENGYFEIALVGCDKVDNAQEKPLQYYIEVKEAGLGEYFTINGGETLSVSDI